MSVHHYDPQELANLALTSAHRGGNGAALESLFDLMAMLSSANGRARAMSYPEEGEPLAWSRDEISRAAKTITRPDEEAARKTLALLRYNLVANNGTDFATVEALTGLLLIALQFVNPPSARIVRSGTSLAYIPVRHACEHFELRYTRWSPGNPYAPEDSPARERGYLVAASACTQCAPQGRVASANFDSLGEAVLAAKVMNDDDPRQKGDAT
jgi:hypothetical protein